MSCTLLRALIALRAAYKASYRNLLFLAMPILPQQPMKVRRRCAHTCGHKDVTTPPHSSHVCDLCALPPRLGSRLERTIAQTRATAPPPPAGCIVATEAQAIALVASGGALYYVNDQHYHITAVEMEQSRPRCGSGPDRMCKRPLPRLYKQPTIQ